jgi:hypothetical protein
MNWKYEKYLIASSLARILVHTFSFLAFSFETMGPLYQYTAQPLVKLQSRPHGKA